VANGTVTAVFLGEIMPATTSLPLVRWLSATTTTRCASVPGPGVAAQEPEGVRRLRAGGAEGVFHANGGAAPGADSRGPGDLVELCALEAAHDQEGGTFLAAIWAGGRVRDGSGHRRAAPFWLPAPVFPRPRAPGDALIVDLLSSRSARSGDYALRSEFMSTIPPPLPADLGGRLRRLRLGAMRRLSPELCGGHDHRWKPEEFLRTLSKPKSLA